MDEDVTWYRSRPRPRPHFVRRGPSSPGERGTAVPLFPAHVYCGHGRPSHVTAYVRTPYREYIEIMRIRNVLDTQFEILVCYSTVVLWFLSFNWTFHFPMCVFDVLLVHYVVAVMAFFKVDHSPQLARQLGIASITFSVITVVLTIVFVLLIYFLVPDDYVKYTWHVHHD